MRLFRGFLLVLCLMGWAFDSLQAVEAGNSCAEAELITTNGSFPFNNSGGSIDQPCNLSNSRAVWFRFTAPWDGYVDADTCGSGFDTVLSAFAGDSCPDECNPIANNDDACGLQSVISFEVTAGTTYLIAVRGFASIVGDGVLNFNYFPSLPNGGDVCAEASAIEINGTYPLDNTSGTASPCNVTAPAVWYSYTAPANGIVNADTCGSNFDTWLMVFSGTVCPTSCTPIVQNDDWCGLQSAVSFAVVEGERYLVAVRGFAGAVGTGVLNFAFVPTAAGADCADAGVITGNGSYAYTTSGASGDDPCPGPNFPSVWYRFMAPSDGVVLANVCDTDYQPYLRIFQANSCPVSCNSVVRQTVPSCDPQSPYSFETVAGATYYFSVSANPSNTSGPGVLRFRFIGSNGDFDRDGKLTVADVTDFASLLKAGVPLPTSVGDFNNDGIVDELDLQALAELIVD